MAERRIYRLIIRAAARADVHHKPTLRTGRRPFLPDVIVLMRKLLPDRMEGICAHGAAALCPTAIKYILCAAVIGIELLLKLLLRDLLLREPAVLYHVPCLVGVSAHIPANAPIPFAREGTGRQCKLISHRHDLITHTAAAAVAVKQQRIFLLGRLAGRIHADEHAHAVAAASAPVALDVRCIVFQIPERLCHAKTRLVLCAIGELLVLLVDRCDKNRVQTPVF